LSRRDKVVNTLLGIFLLGTALIIFFAFMGAGWLGLSAIKYLAGRFLPGRVIPADLLLIFIYGLYAVGYGVAHLRRTLWRNAFLCFAVIPVIGLMWLGHPSSVFGADSFVPLWFLAIFLLIPERSPVPRFEFLLASLIAISAMVLASGLVGTGNLARIVLTCTGVASIVLVVVQTRRRQASDKRGTASPAVA
jgi:hypothetical protein